MKSAISLANIDLSQFEDFLDVDLPDEVVNVATMLSPNERKFLYSLAKDYYKGDGIIIDAGIFLGGSTVCFGEGLKRNPNLDKALRLFDKPIQSFDRAIVYPNFFPFFKRHGIDDSSLKEGDSFESIIRAHINPVSDYVDLKIGDVTDYKSSEDSPKIEILFLDIIKEAHINNFVMANWFHRLIPGKSMVIQQDFFTEDLPYIPISMEYLAEYFDYIGQVHSSSIYILNKSIPQELLQIDYQNDINIEEQMRLIDQAKNRTPFAPRKYFLDAAKVIHAKTLQGCDSELAAQLLSEIIQSYPEIMDSDNARLKRAFNTASTMQRVSLSVNS